MKTRSRSFAWDKMHLCALALTLSLAACTSDTGPSGTVAAPTVDATPMRTRDNPLLVTGHGTAGATLQVRGGSDPVTMTAVGADGAFSVMVPLHANAPNTLLFSQSHA